MALKRKFTINLPHDYLVEVDPLNYTLRRRARRENGEPGTEWKIIGYYKDIPQAIQSYIRHLELDGLDGKELDGLSAYAEQIREIHENAVRELAAMAASLHLNTPEEAGDEAEEDGTDEADEFLADHPEGGEE